MGGGGAGIVKLGIFFISLKIVVFITRLFFFHCTTSVSPMAHLLSPRSHIQTPILYGSSTNSHFLWLHFPLLIHNFFLLSSTFTYTQDPYIWRNNFHQRHLLFQYTIRRLGYKRVYLPLYKVADTPFDIHGRRIVFFCMWYLTSHTYHNSNLWRHSYYYLIHNTIVVPYDAYYSHI